MKISVYCDGSSHASGGKPVGWAYVIVADDSNIIAYGTGNLAAATNNVAELSGAIDGLTWVLDNDMLDNEIELVSDSQYTLGIADGTYCPKKNMELALTLRDLFVRAKATSRWVKGHSGVEHNETCDKLANAAKERMIELLKNPSPIPFDPEQAEV